MTNTNYYDYDKLGTWHPIESLNSDNGFRENIAALYVNYSTSFKNNISLNVGLRGEYTYSRPWNSRVSNIEKQDYFDVFPTANLMIPLNETFSQILVLSYSRKIHRPSFSDLNPFRTPTSEFSYIEGNPRLLPVYANDYSLTWVFKQKYNLTLGVTDRKDDFARISRVDPDDPNSVILRPENISRNTNYFAAASIPVKFTKWWNMNAGLFVAYNMVKTLEEKYEITSFRGMMAHTFEFAKHYNLTVDVVYISSYYNGNIKYENMYIGNASLNRSFLNKKITAGIFVNDLFNSSEVKFKANDADITRKVRAKYDFRNYGITFRYNFNRGKEFRTRNIESASDDDKQRLQVSDR